MKKEAYTVVHRPEETNYKEKFICQWLLDTWLNRAKLQYERIQDGIKKNDNFQLYADIHFFLICFGNIGKFMEKLRNLYKRDEPYAALYKKYFKRVADIDIFRDHLEHITENRTKGLNRKGNPLSDPTTLGTMEDEDTYNFAGEKFSLSETSKLIEELQTDYQTWRGTTPTAT